MPTVLPTGFTATRERLKQSRLRRCAGEHLDPAAILAALPEAMPLAEAHTTVAALLAERQHHSRQGAVVRALRRSAHLAASATRAEVTTPVDCDIESSIAGAPLCSAVRRISGIVALQR